MRKSHLCIILPIYNPHVGWNDELVFSLSQLENHFKDIDFVVAIVNDGSAKCLMQEMESISSAFPFVEYYQYASNKGKGYAIREGVKLVSSDYYIYTDWDLPFGQSAVFETYRLLASNSCQLIIGRRDDTYFKSLPFLRKVVSKSLLIANYLTTGFKVADTQAGLKGLSKYAGEELLLTKVNGFIFEWEFIRACLRKKMTFQFIDIQVVNPLKFSNFSLTTILKELIAYLKILVVNK